MKKGSVPKEDAPQEKQPSVKDGFGQALKKFDVLPEGPAGIDQSPKSQKKEGGGVSSLISKKEKQKPGSFINSVDIALDCYDDIFSDFDSSPYSRRTLSIDFIKEIERRYNAAKEGEIRFVFSLPKKMRNTKDEAVIKERLLKYFDNQIKECEKEARQEQKFSFVLIGGGIVFIALSNLIGLYESGNSFLLKTLHEITLIPGWVGEFLGVEKLLSSATKLKEKEKFYKKLRDASYIFVSTEDIVKKMSESVGHKALKGGNQETVHATKEPNTSA